MTDETHDDATDGSPADAWTDGDDADPPGGTAAGEAPADRTADGGVAAEGAGGRDVRAYLLKGALVLLVVLGVVATLQVYLHAQTAIGRLVTAEYRPLFLAAFNLVVLLAVGIAIAQVVRRL